MEVAERITLGIAVFWALWQLLSLRYCAVNSKGIFPAMIPSFFLFVITIATVLIFHLSPLHLIWLAIACFFLGLPAILFPPIQLASMRFLALLAMTKISEASKEEEESNQQRSSTG